MPLGEVRRALPKPVRTLDLATWVLESVSAIVVMGTLVELGGRPGATGEPTSKVVAAAAVVILSLAIWMGRRRTARLDGEGLHLRAGWRRPRICTRWNEIGGFAVARRLPLGWAEVDVILADGTSSRIPGVMRLGEDRPEVRHDAYGPHLVAWARTRQREVQGLRPAHPAPAASVRLAEWVTTARGEGPYYAMTAVWYGTWAWLVMPRARVWGWTGAVIGVTIAAGLWIAPYALAAQWFRIDLTDDGLTVRSWRRRRLPWSEIEAIGTTSKAVVGIRAPLRVALRTTSGELVVLPFGSSHPTVPGGGWGGRLVDAGVRAEILRPFADVARAHGVEVVVDRSL
ncbi:MAG: hypothetical protein HYX34_05730 [Actinobacteria bacterium]|nr:hypothetical protein [Actinomycetota bacterium]